MIVTDEISLTARSFSGGDTFDPLYVYTIVRRWQAFTGDHARHGTTGRLFDELAWKNNS